LLHNIRLERVVLLVSTLAAFLAPFMMSSINIALPAIQAEFGADAVLLSWIATSYLLSTAAFLLPLAKAGDIWGRKKVFFIGVIIFTISSLTAAISVSVKTLILFRIIQGVGAAMIMTTGVAMLTSAYSAQRRGKAIGINVAAVYVGLSVGPFLGGLLTENFGWRSVFLAIAPVGLACIIITGKYLQQEWADARGEKLDLISSIIYIAALVTLIYGATLLPDSKAYILIILGIIGTILFIRHQLHIENPIFEIKLFTQNRVFAYSNLAALINYAATFAVTFLMSLYLQYIKGLNAQTAGLILIVQPALQAVISPYAGRLSDKKDPGVIASIGMGLTTVGLIFLILLDFDTSLSYTLMVLITLGVGFALFASPNTNAIMGAVEKKYYGIASGAASIMRLLGQMASMVITTVVFALFIGRVEINPANYDSFLQSLNISFAIFAVLCLIGIFFSLARGKVRSRQTP